MLSILFMIDLLSLSPDQFDFNLTVHLFEATPEIEDPHVADCPQ